MNVTKKTVKKPVTVYKKKTVMSVEMTEREAKIIEIAFGSMGTTRIADEVNMSINQTRHWIGDKTLPSKPVTAQEIWDIWAAFDKGFNQ